MSNQQISVVMATYNGEKYIEEQLLSILAQTLKPAEIIVCDDGSNDSTPDILKKFADQNLIRYFVNNPRLGVIGNFVKGASLCNEPNFIAFSDQDDIWLPNKLQVLVDLMVNKTDQAKPAMVFSDADIIDKQNQLIGESLWTEFGIHPDQQTFKTLLVRNIVPGSMMLVNNKMKHELAKIPVAAYMHDAWITFIAYANNNYAYTKQPLVSYRQHDTNVTFSTSNAYSRLGYTAKIKEYIKGIISNDPILEKEFIMAEAFKDVFSNVLNKESMEDFNHFLSLRKRNFLFKKMHIRYINKIEGS